jgi:hypothetical protein
MNQTLTGYTVGIAATLFVAVYLALRYWARQRATAKKEYVTSSGDRTRRSLSSGAQHPSMDVD